MKWVKDLMIDLIMSILLPQKKHSAKYTEIDQDLVIGGTVSALGFKNVQWHNPVKPGGRLRVKHEILELRPSTSRTALGIFRLAYSVFNQNKETVFTLEVAALYEKKRS